MNPSGNFLKKRGSIFSGKWTECLFLMKYSKDPNIRGRDTQSLCARNMPPHLSRIDTEVRNWVLCRRNSQEFAARSPPPPISLTSYSWPAASPGGSSRLSGGGHQLTAQPSSPPLGGLNEGGDGGRTEPRRPVGRPPADGVLLRRRRLISRDGNRYGLPG